MGRHRDFEAESTLAKAIVDFRNRPRPRAGLQPDAATHRARARIRVEAILLWGTVTIDLEYADGAAVRFSADTGGLITPLPLQATGAAWFDLSRDELLRLGAADIHLSMVPGMIQVHFRRHGTVLGAVVAGEGVGLTLADGEGRFTAAPAATAEAAPANTPS